MKDGRSRRGLFKRKSLLTWLTIFLLVAVMLFLYVRQPLMLRQLDNRIYDTFLLAAPAVEPSSVPIIIDIDEEALKLYGQWPWPRYRLAALIESALSKGAAAVALDMLISEPDRSSPRNIRDYLHADLQLEVGFTGLPEQLADYDKLLAEKIRDYPVVLGMYARFGSEAAPEPPDLTRGKTDGHPQAQLPPGVGNVERAQPGAAPMTARMLQAPGVTAPLEELWRAAPVGLINMSPDSDGFVRRVPMLTRVDGKTYVNLALRALMAATGRNSIISTTGPDGLENIRVDTFDMPVSPEGNFTVPFIGPRGKYAYISAVRLLDGTLPADAFEGHILFIGTSAPGLLDIRATPFDRVYPGVEVHAAVLDAVMTERAIITPAATPGWIMICIVLAGLMSGLAFGFVRPKIYVAGGTLLLGGLIGGSWSLFLEGIFISPLYPALTVILQGTVMLALRFWQEERQKLVLRRAFSRYVAPEVVRRITEHHGDLFSGEERELSIMFTDIRGFTAISEKLDPRQVVSLLNRYFTPMTALVRNNSGTLDKFIGDALMAFWNAPLPVEKHAALAVETGLAMQEELQALNISMQSDFGCTIRMGAGIHTGKAYVGNMGSADLVNYTLIGDNVNLTSRLEGLCAQFGLGLVLSEDTVRQCKEADAARFAFQLIDNLRVKGRGQPVFVYTAMRPVEHARREKELANYAKALKLYQHGAFDAALEVFASLREALPHMKLYSVYLERILELKKKPPEIWDGVWTLESK